MFKGCGNMFDWFKTIPLFSLIAFIIVAIVLYFLPSLIAAERKKKQRAVIFCVNLFFGFTGIGWVGALIWAVVREESDGK
jgi:Superinfection immunity protein